MVSCLGPFWGGGEEGGPALILAGGVVLPQDRPPLTSTRTGEPTSPSQDQDTGTPHHPPPLPLPSYDQDSVPPPHGRTQY